MTGKLYSRICLVIALNALAQDEPIEIILKWLLPLHRQGVPLATSLIGLLLEWGHDALPMNKPLAEQ